MKTALITGATGQDAAWLSKLLILKGYKVFLTDRRVSSNKESRYWRLEELGIRSHSHLHIIQATLESYDSLYEAVLKTQPDEVYNLAANSFVSDSFLDEFSCFNINFLGVHRLIKAVQKVVPNARFYQASSSEQFGQVEETPQTEKTRFHPRSPYGISKTAAFELVRHYRERGMHASNGILFNHEGILRGEEFVTRKITKGAIEALEGKTKLVLGNLSVKRDWGSAEDYVEGMWLMLQQSQSDDYVLATGETHSIEEFLEETFLNLSQLLNRSLWWADYVEIDQEFFRPTEVNLLLGDAKKARKALGWKPKTKFKQLVKDMVIRDFERYIHKHRTLVFEAASVRKTLALKPLVLEKL